MSLAKTDFKLRYNESFLGYIWVILKPLLMFTVLNFVFSSIFNFKNSSNPSYPLELLTALLIFQFFSEGVMNGATSLIARAQLVTKIYIPRWIIVLGSTINSLYVFGMNLIVLAIFFVIYNKIPSLEGVVVFFVYSFLLYLLIIAFSFFSAAIYVRFRDVSTVLEILLSILMYISPVVYPLSMMPENTKKIILMNPIAFIINFSKEALILNKFTDLSSFLYLVVCVIFILLISFLVFKKLEKKVAEFI